MENEITNLMEFASKVDGVWGLSSLLIISGLLFLKYAMSSDITARLLTKVGNSLKSPEQLAAERDVAYAKDIKTMRQYQDKLTELRIRTESKALVLYQLKNGETYLTGNPVIKAKPVLKSVDGTFLLDESSEDIPHCVLADVLPEMDKVRGIRPYAISNIECNTGNFSKFIRSFGCGKNAIIVGVKNQAGLIHTFLINYCANVDDKEDVDKVVREMYGYLESFDIDIKPKRNE